MEQRYFVTVDWCGKGNRGVFCDRHGMALSRDDRPHTYEEMWDILGSFAIILDPQSELMTQTALAHYRRWVPLAEYSNAYGVALPALDSAELDRLEVLARDGMGELMGAADRSGEVG